MTKYSEPNGLGVCMQCRQPWGGWDLICNECKQIAAINQIANRGGSTFGSSGGIGYSHGVSDANLMWIIVIAFITVNYYTNWFFVKFIWILLKAGFWLFFGWWMGYSPSEII